MIDVYLSDASKASESAGPATYCNSCHGTQLGPAMSRSQATARLCLRSCLRSCIMCFADVAPDSWALWHVPSSAWPAKLGNEYDEHRSRKEELLSAQLRLHVVLLTGLQLPRDMLDMPDHQVMLAGRCKAALSQCSATSSQSYARAGAIMRDSRVCLRMTPQAYLLLCASTHKSAHSRLWARLGILAAPGMEAGAGSQERMARRSLPRPDALLALGVDEHRPRAQAMRASFRQVIWSACSFAHKSAHLRNAQGNEPGAAALAEHQNSVTVATWLVRATPTINAHLHSMHLWLMQPN